MKMHLCIYMANYIAREKRLINLDDFFSKQNSLDFDFGLTLWNIDDRRFRARVLSLPGI